MLNKLFEIMNEIEHIDESDLYIKKVHVPDLKLIKIRDYLMVDGAIVTEDLENNIYTAYFKCGLLKLKRVLVGIMLDKGDLIVVGSPKNNSKKIVNKLLSNLTEKKDDKKSKYKKHYLLTLLVFIIGASTFGYFTVSSSVNATKKYDIAVEEFNDLADNYNEKVKLVSVDNIEGVPSEVTLLSTEKTDLFSVATSVIKGNSSSKINRDTQTIYTMIDTLQEGSKIIESINNPSGALVESKLKNIKEINQIKSVTIDNDPNGFLNKEHGYTSCTYFTILGLTIDGVTSTDPVVLGTDGGGSVEVYANLDDAIARYEYLKQFENTMLYSGSYSVVGTMVVRVSYVLTDEQQFTLTDYIVQQFTHTNELS